MGFLKNGEAEISTSAGHTDKKKILAIALLLLCAFNIYALTHPDVSIFVSPVTGSGISPDDNYFFYNQLTAELTGWGYEVAPSVREADYTLNGKIAFFDEGGYNAADYYSFQLELHYNGTDINLVEFGFVYNSLDDSYLMLTSLLYTILNVIPVDEAKDTDIWRNKKLYVGASAFWTPRVYTDSKRRSDHFSNFGAGILAEFQFLNFLSIGAGAEIASDVIAITENSKDHYRNLLLELPLMIKFVIKPGSHFMLEPYGGILFNIPLYDTTNPYLLSWMAGFQYGVKAGGHVLFLDSRFAMDLGKSSLKGYNGDSITFNRYVIHIGVGFKFGFFKKQSREAKSEY